MDTLTMKSESTITHTVKWFELCPIIRDYLTEHYQLDIPDEAQFRMLNRNGAMIDPFELRIKYKKGDRLCRKK